MNFRVVAQQLDSTFSQHEFDDLVAESGETVFVCHRHLSDITLHASSKKGPKTPSFPVEPAADVRHDFPARVLASHVIDLALEVVFLSAGGYAAIADVDFLFPRRFFGVDVANSLDFESAMTSWQDGELEVSFGCPCRYRLLRHIVVFGGYTQGYKHRVDIRWLNNRSCFFKSYHFRSLYDITCRLLQLLHAQSTYMQTP